MSYRITVFEPNLERRDHPTLGHMGQTQRTVGVFTIKTDAIAAARVLLNTDTEVMIWREAKGIGKPVEDWLPAQIIILDNPREALSEADRQSSRDRRRRVDWYVYEYTGSDGERYRKSFETVRGEHPQIPLFGTHGAINALRFQWQCWDCRGEGWSGGDRDSQEACFTCGGSGQRRAKSTTRH